MTGFVYCFGNPGGMVKIGWSAKPERRLVKLQSDTPHLVTFVGAVAGTRETEAGYHARFAHLHHRGEWFEDTNGEISGAFPRYVPALPCEPVVDLPSWLRVHGVTQREMAVRIGISEVKLSKIVMGKRRITVTEALRVQAATAGQVPVEWWAQGRIDCEVFDVTR